MLWLPESGEIFGARTNRKMHAGELARDQAGVLQVANPNRKIDIFSDQIDLAVIQIDFEFNFWVIGHESVNRFGKLAHAKPQRQGKPDFTRYLALRVGDDLFSLVQISEDLQRALMKFASSFGQRLPPRGTL